MPWHVNDEKVLIIIRTAKQRAVASLFVLISLMQDKASTPF